MIHKIQVYFVLLVGLIIPTCYADQILLSDRFACTIIQASQVNENGFQIPATQLRSYSKGEMFFVDRNTGRIIGRSIDTTSWQNKVIGEGKDGQNAFVTIAVAKIFKNKKETNGTWFLVIDSYQKLPKFPFFLRDSMGTLVSGLCE
jgi:hypothetical protein